MTTPRYSLEELEARAELLDLTIAELAREWSATGVLPGDDDDDDEDGDDDDDDEGDE